MGLSFFDPRTGAAREFRPAAAPKVGVEAAGRGPRELVLAAALGDVLRFVGLEPVAGTEIRVGGEAPAPEAVWLAAPPLAGTAPAPVELASRGFSADDVRFLCLRTHYRRPLAFSWEALAAARDERRALAEAARSLAGTSQEPSPRARAAYLLRFRDSLSRDLDLPGALDCVWDALRPGALSPGSRAALLREALPALGLAAASRS
jgi:hypothetical protein